MLSSDPQWQVIRCPECSGLLKVDQSNVPSSLACPACGCLIDQDEGDPTPAVDIIRSGPVEEPTEGSADEPTPESQIPDPNELVLEQELAHEAHEAMLDEELGKMPETGTPLAGIAATSGAIPKPKPTEFKIPEMVSNIGERQWSPVNAERSAPKLDASRIASTDDERLAPEPEAEEGAVKTHVARKITGWDLEDEEESGEPAFQKVRKKMGLIGICVVSALLFGVVVYGVSMSLKKPPGGKIEKPERPEVAAREAMTAVERDAMDKAEETFAAAGEAIENFLNAPTYRERQEFVRDPERVEPLMEAHYKRNPDGAFAFRPPKDGWRMAPFESFLLTSVEGEDFSLTAIAVERQEDGRYLVDWESFVGYSELPFERLMERKPTDPVLLRARASVGDYYNFGYVDSEWACVQLQDMSQANTIYAYTKVDSEILQQLMKIMTLRGETHLTLKVVHPGGDKASNQFEITDVISRGWVFSDEDEELGSEG